MFRSTLGTRARNANPLTAFTFGSSRGLGQGGTILYGQHGLSGHTIHTSPSHLYDGGPHTPLIMRRRDHVPAGEVSDLLVSRYGLGPTRVDHLDKDPGQRNDVADHPAYSDVVAELDASAAHATGRACAASARARERERRR
ncbi:hypothetical protein ACO0M4_10680 [Streptomyces sp. RGM 3693]|uniref:hypothetical protein n=1 Tax=Streptomyces sp. RGM 3693 TaxID=3413284 RepID=UPI003D2AC326